MYTDFFLRNVFSGFIFGRQSVLESAVEILGRREVCAV